MIPRYAVYVDGEFVGIVIAENQEDANRMAKMLHGSNAVAVKQ
jgi:hypothetical protein